MAAMLKPRAIGRQPINNDDEEISRIAQVKLIFVCLLFHFLSQANDIIIAPKYYDTLIFINNQYKWKDSDLLYFIAS